MDASNLPTSYVSSDAKLFMEMIASVFEWNDLSNDLVMDVGCGNPRVKFCNLLVERFPNVKVIAIDKKSYLINYIKCNRNHPRIDFQFADIEDKSSLKEWEGKISKVVSSHCFHQLKDQKVAFQNVYDLMKPGGEAAILFCLKSGFAAWHSDIAQHNKWNRYYNGNSPEVPVTQFLDYDASYYKNILEEIGFEIVMCHKDKIGVPFESEGKWEETTLNLGLSSFGIRIELREEFKKDVLAAFMEHNCRTVNGNPCQISEFLTALLRKPAGLN